MATELALPMDVMAKLAEEAKAAAAKERPALGKISLRNGVMSYADTPIKDNKMEVVVLSSAFRNVWYAGKFNADNIVNPNCFAISLDDENMAPHENVTDPESETCAKCEKSQWGSDPEGGRGKACKQGRRLALMPASALDGPLDKIKTAELAIMDLPVTSVKNYSAFVNALSASAGVPPYAAVTEVECVKDPKTQFKVVFRPLRVLPSMEILDAVKARMEEAQRIVLTPFDETVSREDQERIDAEAEAKKASKGKAKY